jgi:branched-chain amino acid transport system substrate-binding protein
MKAKLFMNKESSIIGFAVLIMVVMSVGNWAVSASAATEVKLGVIYPMTGANALGGQEAKRAIELAVSKINSEGGIKSLGGAMIKPVFADNEGTPTKSVSEAERLITVEKVNFIIGPYGSAEALPMSEITNKYKIPMINAKAYDNRIHERGLKYVWSTTLRNATVAPTVIDCVDWLVSRGLKADRVALLSSDTTYAQSLVVGYRKLLMERKYNVVSDISYPEKSTDLIPVMNRVKVSNPDLLIQISHFGSGQLAFKARYDLDFYPANIGISTGAVDTRFVKILGSEVTAKAMDNTFGQLEWASDINIPGSKKVVAEYKSKYGEPLEVTGAAAYQAALLMRIVLEKAGSLDPDAIRTAFGQIHIKQGDPDMIVPYKSFKFDERGVNEGMRGVVVQWQDSKLVTVWPEEVASGKLRIPSQWRK